MIEDRYCAAHKREIWPGDLACPGPEDGPCAPSVIVRLEQWEALQAERAELVEQRNDIARGLEVQRTRNATLRRKVQKARQSRDRLRAEFDKVGDYLNGIDMLPDEGEARLWGREPGTVILNVLRDVLADFKAEREANRERAS